MVRPTKREPEGQVRNDPGESNDPKSSKGDFEAHIWTSLNMIFERLGKIDQKVDQLSEDHKNLKTSVDKHEKLVTRIAFGVGGAVVVILALWFIYANFLKGYLQFNSAAGG